ncbi:hypothetical protein BN7_4286 [Wickerhamomyces ciferrii]|uniref:AAA+ ATPase domain-containing protein n=1 Tax=Wickerhamomyces ciferrii (strain ATCC 14091 / BCRC 22168 / CBS 111 / JCM 3599 / NBRC 0793 / NRRL Y-1031 F-60-10) TaxID=1206466 RepID=K0KU16_WICCF|nr:uncharacterized protein BN7_4286 [Wickerhamomyces ciferrii]CCH44718.1 hypothetical protein BN7_4286 [Wickerhamomyces ciferrii]
MNINTNINYLINIEALQKPIDSSQIVLIEFINLNHDIYKNILITAISLYLKNHEDTLIQHSELELMENFTEFNISNELLSNLISSPLTLSKSELLISIFIKSIEIIDGICLSDDEQNPDDGFPTDKTSFNITIYENLNIEKNLIEDFDNITLNSNNSQFQLFEYSYITQSITSPEVMEFLEMNIIPNSNYQHLWKNLKFNNFLKNQLIGHSKISLILSQKSLKPLILNNVNKILLLYGPSGSGKTSLCKALAQKLSIQMKSGCLIEFKCSKIFSRFFGESSKNLELIFQNFRKLIEMNPDINFILLIDEIETLASSRSNLLKQNETNDGIRVVNTLLTQLDFLKPFNNFLILTTSNNKNSLDDAFLDRCDEIFYIERPNNEAIMEILIQSINELIENKIIIHNEKISSIDHKFSPVLSTIATMCYDQQISGRNVSRLPLITLAKFFSNRIPINLLKFLESLNKLIREK